MLNTSMIGAGTRNVRASAGGETTRDPFFDKARSPFQLRTKHKPFLFLSKKNDGVFTSDEAKMEAVECSESSSSSWRSAVGPTRCYLENYSKVKVPKQAYLRVDNQTAALLQREHGAKHLRTNNVDFRSILPTLKCRPFDKDTAWSPDSKGSLPSIDVASNEGSQSSQSLQLQLRRDVRKYLRSLRSREDPLHFIDAPLFPHLISVEAALADSTVVEDLRKQCLMFLTMTKRLKVSHREQVFLAMQDVAEELLQEIYVFCRERLHETSAKFMVMVYSDEITNWFLPAYKRALWRIKGLVGIQQVVLNSHHHHEHALTDTTNHKITGSTHGVGVYWEFAHHSSHDNGLLNKVMIPWLGRHWHDPYLDEKDLQHLVVQYELDSVAVGAWHRNAVLNVVAPVRELDIALLSMVGEKLM